LSAEFAVTARVCTGLAQIKALLAISDLHFVAFHGCIPVRMVSALHEEIPFSAFALTKKYLSVGKRLTEEPMKFNLSRVLKNRRRVS
jgi:hypothetical protein